MDEIEYRQAYNEACNAVTNIKDTDNAPAIRNALLCVLQLIDSHQQAIEEMQTAEDEDEC